MITRYELFNAPAAIACPFCGKDIAHINADVAKGYCAMTCDTCGAQGPLTVRADNASTTWNIRVMPKFVVNWEIPPDTKITFGHLSQNSVEVRCTLGNANAIAKVSIYQFPVPKSLQDMIEYSVKQKCLSVLFEVKP